MFVFEVILATHQKRSTCVSCLWVCCKGSEVAFLLWLWYCQLPKRGTFAIQSRCTSCAECGMFLSSLVKCSTAEPSGKQCQVSLSSCGIAALLERSARCQEVMPGLTSEFAKLGVRSLWQPRSTDQPNQTQMKMKHISKKLANLCFSHDLKSKSNKMQWFDLLDDFE